MTIQIELSPEEEHALREQARLSGCDLAQYARDILRDHVFHGNDKESTLEDLIDHELVAACERETESEGDIPSIEEVREILAKIPGSMAQAIIEGREDRF